MNFAKFILPEKKNLDVCIVCVYGLWSIDKVFLLTNMMKTTWKTFKAFFVVFPFSWHRHNRACASMCLLTTQHQNLNIKMSNGETAVWMCARVCDVIMCAYLNCLFELRRFSSSVICVCAAPCYICMWVCVCVCSVSCRAKCHFYSSEKVEKKTTIY